MRTDANGNYSIKNIPVGFDSGLSITHPDLGTHQLDLFQTVSTVNAGGQNEIAAQGGKKQIGPSGRYDRKLTTRREIRVRIISPSTSQPIAAAKIEAIPPKGSTVHHTTTSISDQNGIGVLRLIPGEYDVKIIPPVGSNLWATSRPLTVKTDTENSLYNLLCRSALHGTITAQCDGVGIPRVRFEYTADRENWLPVGSQGGAIEFAMTDRNGQLKAVLPTNAIAVRIGNLPPTHQLTDNTPVEIILPTANESDRFAFKPITFSGISKKTVALAGRENVESSYRTAISTGRFRYRRNNYLQKDISLEDFASYMKTITDLEPEQALERLKDFFGRMPLQDKRLFQDAERRRIETTYLLHGRIMTDHEVNDGQQTFVYSNANQQCDVYLIANSRRGMDSIRDMVAMPINYPAAIKTELDGQISYESNVQQSRAIQLRDANTDFVRYQEAGNAATFLRSSWQLHPFEANGYPFPRMVLTAAFQKGRLEHAELTVFDEVELVQQLGGDAFAMDAPAGTLILDYRAGEERGEQAFSMLNSDTFDLASRMRPLSTITGGQAR